MKKDFEASESLLETILNRNKKRFLKTINGMNAYNILFAIAMDTPPSILLDKEHEANWDGKVRMRKGYDTYYTLQINHSIREDTSLIGLRKVGNNIPNLTMYYIDEQGGKVYALLEFDKKLSCSRIINYDEELPYLVGILNAYELFADRKDIIHIKHNLSSFYSSKNRKVYKRKVA